MSPGGSLKKSAHSAFTGEGARLFEGRWNSAGTPVVYCSENVALAALEILVHTQPAALRDVLRVFRVTFDWRLMKVINRKELPLGWNAQPAGSASKQLGDEWARAARSVVLALPSVLVPLERTYLLNPAHPDFAKIKIEDAGEFRLDQCLR